MVRKSPILISILASLLIIACDSKRHTEKYVGTDWSNGWHQDSTVCIETQEVDDLSKGYNFLVVLRHTTSFKYKNIFFFIDVVSPSGKTVRDTAELVLQDPQGYWYGEGNGFLRSVQEHTINGYYKRNIQLTEKGKYQVCIQHGMRDERLDEITDVGIRVEYMD